MEKTLREVTLVADSPRKAFYRLKVIDIGLGFLIQKESGAAGKVLDRETWFRPTRKEAEAFFERRLRAKTNPARKSPRIYRTEDAACWPAEAHGHLSPT